MTRGKRIAPEAAGEGRRVRENHICVADPTEKQRFRILAPYLRGRLFRFLFVLQLLHVALAMTGRRCLVYAIFLCNAVCVEAVGDPQEGPRIELEEQNAEQYCRKNGSHTFRGVEENILSGTEMQQRSGVRMPVLQNMRLFQPVGEHQFFVCKNLFGGAIGHNLPCVEDDGPRTQADDKFEVMRGNDPGSGE
jgi:hypothetical protein